jgi:hypothetical protein
MKKSVAIIYISMLKSPLAAFDWKLENTNFKEKLEHQQLVNKIQKIDE